jgi:hypothetical protein
MMTPYDCAWKVLPLADSLQLLTSLLGIWRQRTLGVDFSSMEIFIFVKSIVFSFTQCNPFFNITPSAVDRVVPQSTWLLTTPKLE